MVTITIGGKKVGEVALPDDVRTALAASADVTLRDDAGNPFGRIVPEPHRSPNEPIIPWEPGVSRAELDARDARPGLSFDEVRRRLGWE